MTKPVENILPLPLHAEAVPILNFLHDSVHEIVCFGTHILAWSLEKGKDAKEPGTEIDMVVPLLFRHLLEITDAISVQIKSGAIAPCKIHLRAYIEAFLSLEYILEKDTYRRSASFMIVDHYRKLDLYKKLTIGTSENTKLQDELQKHGFMIKKLNPINAEKAYKNILSLIQKPLYKEVREEYERLLKQKKDIKFYNLFSNITSVKWLSMNLGYYDFYEFFYKEWSNPTHGTNLHTGVLVLGDNGMGAINQIRNLENVVEIVSRLTVLSLVLYSSMAKRVIPDRRKEHAEWHQSFKITYRDKIDKMEAEGF